MPINSKSLDTPVQLSQIYENSVLSEIETVSFNDKDIKARSRNTKAASPSLFDRIIEDNCCTGCSAFQKIYFTLLFVVFTSVIIYVIVYGVKRQENERLRNVYQNYTSWCGSSDESARICHAPCASDSDCLEDESCYKVQICNNSVYSLG